MDDYIGLVCAMIAGKMILNVKNKNVQENSKHALQCSILRVVFPFKYTQLGRAAEIEMYTEKERLLGTEHCTSQVVLLNAVCHFYRFYIFKPRL